MTTRFALLASALLVGCMASPPAPLAPTLLTQHVGAPPAAIMTAATRVLALHGFTLAPMDRASGVVQSQPLEVTRTWDGAPVTARADCGKDGAGVERARTNPVQVTLAFIATADASGTTVQLRPTVTTYDAVARNMASRNIVAAAQSATTSCELKAAFVQSLMAEIASGALTQ